MDLGYIILILLGFYDTRGIIAQTTRFPVYIKGLVRTTPGGTVTHRPGKIWDGSEPKPAVPGDKAYFDSVEIQKVWGGDCQAYPNMHRGTYTNKNGKDLSYYPWTSYVMNCDVKRFLYCKNGKCECFPGFYWNKIDADDPNGMCVAGYGQDCSTFIGYDFRLRVFCGEGMECVNHGSEDKAKAGVDQDPPRAENETYPRHCVCYQKLAKYTFQGTQALTKRGEKKLFCDKIRPVEFKGPCDEHYQPMWESNTVHKRVERTVTGCNDLPPSNQGKWTNVYCKFPKSMTGKAGDPKDAAGNPVNYGQRTGGTCDCTDYRLTMVFDTDTGHEFGCTAIDTRKVVKCDPNDKGGIKDIRTWDFVNQQTTYDQSYKCGEYTVCAKTNQTIFNKTGVDYMCECAKGPNGHQYSTILGKCDPNEDPDGANRKVGDFCPFEVSCNEHRFQECVRLKGNDTCQCIIGYKADRNKDCKGLYGSVCKDVDDCFPDSGFICAKVPELNRMLEGTDLASHHTADQRYCVCKRNFLNIETGMCGAGDLIPIQAWLLIIATVIISLIS